MNRKDFSTKQGKKVHASELRKKEKECRKLQQELTVVSSICVVLVVISMCVVLDLLVILYTTLCFTIYAHQSS